MSPSNYTIAVLLLAFLIFTTMKGNLVGYLKVIGVA